jgi:hypothetical protein
MSGWNEDRTQLFTEKAPVSKQGHNEDRIRLVPCVSAYSLRLCGKDF